MPVTLYYFGRIYAARVVGRRGEFLRFRVRGEVSGQYLEQWLVAGPLMRGAYQAGWDGADEKARQRLQDATYDIPPETHEQLIFAIDHL